MGLQPDLCYPCIPMNISPMAPTRWPLPSDKDDDNMRKQEYKMLLSKTATQKHNLYFFKMNLDSTVALHII